MRQKVDQLTSYGNSSILILAGVLRSRAYGLQRRLSYFGLGRSLQISFLYL